MVDDTFSACEQLPESKLESMITSPKVNVLCDSGIGYFYMKKDK